MILPHVWYSIYFHNLCQNCHSTTILHKIKLYIYHSIGNINRNILRIRYENTLKCVYFQHSDPYIFTVTSAGLKLCEDDLKIKSYLPVSA